MTSRACKIAAFYKFCDLGAVGDIQGVRELIRGEMSELGILGTVILASEGFNATVSGAPANLDEFLEKLAATFSTSITPKFSFADEPPFRKIDVKIKPEIVTLKKPVDITQGVGTHISASEWNELISDPEVIVVDTRNDYEFKNGTFKRAINPGTE